MYFASFSIVPDTPVLATLSELECVDEFSSNSFSYNVRTRINVQFKFEQFDVTRRGKV